MFRLPRILVCSLFAIFLTSSAFPISAQQQILPPWRTEFPKARQTAEISVGDSRVVVDLALTPDQQQLGLGYRNGLLPGTGMLFVFPEASDRTFWMKGMRFCLDIIWIEGGAITGAAERVCPDPDGTQDAERQRFPSRVPVTYVLEMPAGWLSANGYGMGTTVTIPTRFS